MAKNPIRQDHVVASFTQLEVRERLGDVSFEDADGVLASKRFLDILGNLKHCRRNIHDVHCGRSHIYGFAGMETSAAAQVKYCKAGAFTECDFEELALKLPVGG